jgi:hypothetical protein
MKNWGVYILAALGFGIYGAVMEADRDDSGAIVSEGTVDAFQVRVGDCFDDSSSDAEGEITSIPGVPCSEEHDNEAFAVIDLTIPSYPEGDAMAGLAYTSCVERFEAFVGKDYASSSLEIFPIYPTPESWAQDDREVICAIYEMDENKLVGSVKGRAL